MPGRLSRAQLSAELPSRPMYAKDGQRDGRSGATLVGYLDDQHPFATGSVPGELIAELEHLAATSYVGWRGYHYCELCSGPAEQRARCSRDIVLEIDGRRYQSPAMIAHYIREHGYCPPAEYLDLIRRHREERRP